MEVLFYIVGGIVGLVAAIWLGATVYGYIWGFYELLFGKGEPGKSRPARRRRRGAKVPRRDVLWAIREAGSNGIGRSGIIQELGVKGDSTAENSVTYQLAQIRKRRLARHERRKYYTR